MLFDPVFTARCSPLSFLGPKRYTEMPCEIEAIPAIDAVVISHNHYDHLSLPTVKRIKAANPNVHFFVPLGNLEWFEKVGIDAGVTELDWWEEREVSLRKGESVGEGIDVSVSADADESANGQQKSDKGGDNDRQAPDMRARISCLPCQHTSARTPFDKGQTLWASWSVESGGRKVWFGGYVFDLSFSFEWAILRTNNPKEKRERKKKGQWSH